MAKNNRTLITLFIVGFSCLLLSLWFYKNPTPTKNNSNIAMVEPLSGEVIVLRKSFTSKDSIRELTQLYPLDNVDVGIDSEAILDFPTGHRLTLNENTSITVNKENETYIVILRRGNYQIESEGPKNKVLISKNGVRWDVVDYLNLNNKESLPQINEVASPAANTSSSVMPSSPTPEYIASIMTGYRDSFQRCYSQILLKNSSARGDSSLSFTILRNGKTSEPKIISSSISDPAFKKCLIDVVARAHFKSFQGEPITTVFPLKFE